MKTFTGIENLEASLVRKMAISRETDSLVGSGTTKVAGALDAAKAPGGFAEATGWGAAISGGLGALTDTFASARPRRRPSRRVAATRAIQRLIMWETGSSPRSMS